MPSRSKKTGTTKPGLERPGPSQPDNASRKDTDLQSFRLMSRVSRETTAKELDELIRAAD
jgi:hypothetical protein